MWVEIINDKGEVLKVPKNAYETFHKCNGFRIKGKDLPKKKTNLKEIVEDDKNRGVITDTENENEKSNK